MDQLMDQISDLHLRVVHPERVKMARREASPEDELQRLALIYKILGDPSRLKILMALRRTRCASATWQPSPPSASRPFRTSCAD